MKEQVLLFHFEERERLSALQKALLPLHITCHVVPEEQWDMPVGALVGLETLPQEEPECVELTAEVLLMCGLTENSLQAVLAALRKAGLYIPYKAFLTQTNKDWNVGQLFGELYQEHQYMMAMQREKQNRQQ